MAEQKINIALESSVEDVKTSIGTTGNTGGSITVGTIFGKLNKIIADLASHISSWTSTRAGYIDIIKSNTDRLTSARATIIDNIGATSNTGGTTSAGTVMAKLNALITNTTANNTASKTGVLSAKLAYVISLLENTTYGLSALKTAVSSSGGMKLKSVTKTYINPNSGSTTTEVEANLTTSQIAGLYSIRVDSSTSYNGSVTSPVTMAYIGGIGTNAGTFLSMGYKGGSSGVNDGSVLFNPTTNKVVLGGRLASGTITFYYFE